MAQPVNQNLLGQNGFQLVIERLPTTQYFTQEIKLPGIELPEAPTQDSPFAIVPHPGDRIKWSPFEITFKVDEDMVNYKELHNWMVAIGHPKTFGQTKAYMPSSRISEMLSDATLLVLSSHKNPRIQVRFLGIFPISLSGLDFTSTDADVTFLDATAQFAYLRYEFPS